MADVRPFRALRPRDDLAGRVIAPPYDVLTEDEARAIAQERRSFVRVTRSEVDLPVGTDSHSEEAYRKARENLDAFVADGTLVEDEEPTYYFYGQTMFGQAGGAHTQIGIVAACSVAEYDTGLIAKHEFTRPDKEDDRTHHMDVLDAQVGLVLLAHRPTARLDALTAEITAGKPAWEVTTDDAVVHRLWPAPLDKVADIGAAWAEVPKIYIADGHHRSAAASRIHKLRKDGPTAHFLSGLYPSDRLQILPYNRVIHDLHGHTAESLIAAIGEKFGVIPNGAPSPAKRGEFGMYLGGSWYTLCALDRIRTSDPVAGLDVSLLQDHVLAPLLGIADPRRSDRVTFVGGIRGTKYLSDAVDQRGEGVAFSLFATSLDELFSVADAGEVMPPKSTWFEPKLREGVAIRRL